MDTNYTEDGNIKMPVLGRSGFRLGSLYDIRSDTISETLSLWKTSTIENGKTSQKVSHSHYDVQETNTIETRSALLKMNGKLAISVMCDATQVGGCGNFIKESKSSVTTIGTTLLYENTTYEELIPTEMFQDMDFQESLDNEAFTHAVIAIEYGGKALMSFQKECSIEESKEEAQKVLNDSVENIVKSSVELKEAPSKETITELDKAKVYPEESSFKKNNNEVDKEEVQSEERSCEEDNIEVDKVEVQSEEPSSKKNNNPVDKEDVQSEQPSSKKNNNPVDKEEVQSEEPPSKENNNPVDKEEVQSEERSCEEDNNEVEKEEIQPNEVPRKGINRDVDNITCRYFGDFELKSMPNSYNDAVRSYEELINNNEDKAIPVNVVLMPLTKLGSKIDRKYISVNDDLLQECYEHLGEIISLQTTLEEIKSRAAQTCPIIFELCKKAEQLRNAYQLNFQNKLNGLLKQYCYGEDGIPDALNRLFDDYITGPFCFDYFHQWITTKENEINNLEKLIHNITKDNPHIQILEPTTSVEDNTNKNHIKFLLKIPIEDGFIDQMESCLKTSNFHESITIKSAILEKQVYGFKLAERYREFAFANRDNANTLFWVQQSKEDNLQDISKCYTVVAVKNNITVEWDEMISAPINLQVSSLSHKLCEVTWMSPEYGQKDIKQYEISIYEVSNDVEEILKEKKVIIEKMDVSIDNLGIFTKYKIMLKAVTNKGFSPTASLEFTTLASEPVGSIVTNEIGNNFAVIKWEEPLKVSSDAVLESYKIVVNKIKEDETLEVQFAETISQENLVLNINNLEPMNKYQVSVQVVTNKGKSIIKTQSFFTASQGNLTKEILHEFWSIVLSTDFVECNDSKTMIKEINKLIMLKSQLNNDLMMDGEELLVRQILLSTEFKIFIERWTKVFLEVEYTQEVAGRYKMKELIGPFDENSELESNDNMKLFDWIFLKRRDEYSKLSFESISDLVTLMKQCEKEKIFFHQFKKGLTRFLQYADDNFDDLDSHILFLLLRKYKINQTEKVLSDETVNICELVNDLSNFQESILDKRNDGIEMKVHEVNCIRYSMKLSNNNKEEFKALASIIINQPKDILDTYQYMNEFLSKWKVSKLDQFLHILETTRNFSDFFGTFEISKKVASQLSSLSKKMEKQEPIKENEEDLITLKGNKMTENHYNEYAKAFQNLTFQKYLQESLTRKDIYSIEKPNKDTSDSSAPLNFLKKLLSLDSRCRIQSEREENLSQIEEEDDNDMFFIAACNTEDIDSENKNTVSDFYSSADIVLVALAACDPFLLQDVFEKLSACQLAVPIIFSNPKAKCSLYHLWALKGIKKKWIQKINSKSIEANITTISCETISFCRIGKINTSKSKIANSFLSTAQGCPEHSYFLNRDNDIASCLNNGSIEACWYCPEGSEKENLSDFTCIYNLRGDARQNQTEFDFLLTVSTLVVIFLGNKPLTKDEKSKLIASNCHVILIQTEKEGVERKSGNMKLLFGKEKTINSIAKDICKNMNFDNNNIETCKKLNLNEHANLARSIGIAVDEDNKHCQEGKKHAEEFMELINKHKIEDLKSNVVPLQGEPWKIWAETDKEEFRHKLRSETDDPQRYSSDLRDTKRQCREQQRKISPSDAIIKFIESLITLSGDSYNYFLEYVQLYLNRNSEIHLPHFLKKYNDCSVELNNSRRELEALYETKNPNRRKEKEIRNKMEMATKRVKDISGQFDLASFGIEHIFRELAQVYESLTDISSSLPPIVEQLPKLMVELILQGYPLEIMDGNVSQIPITWLEKVFLELKHRLNNAKVHVVSILGIQSSGKSTFLNTMHGSKFSVSSGRCTRGVFVQLLPVKEECRESLKCDYYMLMDSEGLRSPELGESFHHDNEIATLITCLANLTIINFWGQTFSKDMADVILIAAYAYIRMSEVNIKSSFHMIFASVQDVTAAERNKFGVTKIMEEINKMVLNVAKSEGRKDLFQGLKSIFPMLQESYPSINFPQFLPVLWHGSMSPPEARYGELVNEIKNSMMEILSDTNGIHHVQPIQEFLNRLKDVWRAIKMENFIFGFRNTQAVQVYNQMQILYEENLKVLRDIFFKEAWPLERDAVDLSLKKDENNKINKAVSAYEESVENKVVPKLEHQSKLIIDELRKFISTLSNPDHGMMHLDTFEMHLKKTTGQLLRDEQERVVKKIQVAQRKQMSAAEKQKNFQKTFILRARELALEVRKKEGEDASVSISLIIAEFECHFESFLFAACKEDLKTFGSPSDVFDKIFKSCLKYLQEKLDLLNLKNRKEPTKHITRAKRRKETIGAGEIIPQIDEKTVCIEGWGRQAWNKIKSTVKDTEMLHRKDALKKLKLIEKRVKNIINDSSTQGDNYENTVSTVLQYVWNETKNDQNEWSFQKEFRMKLFINFFIYTVCKMEERQLKIFEKFSLERFLLDKKSDFRREFEEDCTTANIEIRSAETYAKDVLLASVIYRVKTETGNEIYNDLTGSEMFSNKNQVMYQIQKELLDEPALNVYDFCKYFNIYAKKWINSHVNEFCYQNGYLKRKLESRIEIDKTNIIQTLEAMAIKAKQEGMSTIDWYELLEAELKSKPMIQDIQIERAALCLIQDIQFASGEMIRVLFETKASTVLDEIVEQSLEENSEQMKNIAVLNWFNHNPLENLIKERIGCDAQCVFCGAKCSAGIPCTNSRHQTDMHRPSGITGYRFMLTGKLVSDICTYLVASNITYKLTEEYNKKYNVNHDNYMPYKNVATVVTDWHIPPIPDAKSTEYWQYMFAKHHVKIAELTNAGPANIPSGWNSVTKEDAIRCLKSSYNIGD